jgi:tRNA nucleotidyltransferase (CCA-adding enzyme)
MGKGNDPNCGATILEADMNIDTNGDELARAVAQREQLLAGIRPLGFPAVYEVGGCVRDELMGRPPKDIDLMVAGLTYEELLAACQTVGSADPLESKGNLIGVRLSAPFTPKGGVEIALARTEVSTGAGHGDFDITPIAIPEHLAELPYQQRAGDPVLTEHVLIDAARRDLTVNAIARNIETGELVDPYGGAEDVKAGRLRAVSQDTFRDDPLRCFRLLTRVAKDGSEPDPQTEAMVREWAAKLRRRKSSAQRQSAEVGSRLGAADPGDPGMGGLRRLRSGIEVPRPAR